MSGDWTHSTYSYKILYANLESSEAINEAGLEYLGWRWESRVSHSTNKYERLHTGYIIFKKQNIYAKPDVSFILYQPEELHVDTKV